MVVLVLLFEESARFVDEEGRVYRKHDFRFVLPATVIALVSPCLLSAAHDAFVHLNSYVLVSELLKFYKLFAIGLIVAPIDQKQISPL